MFKVFVHDTSLPKMKSIKKKSFLHKMSKIGSDLQKVQHLASVLKNAGILTGLATFVGGIATGGVGIAVVTVGVAGLAISKLLSKKKGKHNHKFTDEQKVILTTLLEKIINDCEKIDNKLTDEEKQQIETILILLKHDKNDADEINIDDAKDDTKDKDKEKQKNDDKDKDLIETILSLLENKDKPKDKS